MTYETLTNDEVMESAKKSLDENLDKEVVRLFNLDATKANVKDVAELIQLQYNYQKTGDMESFRETSRY